MVGVVLTFWITEKQTVFQNNLTYIEFAKISSGNGLPFEKSALRKYILFQR